MVEEKESFSSESQSDSDVKKIIDEMVKKEDQPQKEAGKKEETTPLKNLKSMLSEVDELAKKEEIESSSKEDEKKISSDSLPPEEQSEKSSQKKNSKEPFSSSQNASLDSPAVVRLSKIIDTFRAQKAQENT